MLSATPLLVTMARLADPVNRPGELEELQCGDVPTLVANLQRNKVPLMAVASRAPRWLSEHPVFKDALDAEREWHHTQRSEYVLVRDAWLRAGIPCVMIKSAGNHPAFPHTSDNIDVLVRPAQARAARDIVRGLGYVELRNVEEPGKFLFRKFHGGRCVSAIHIHELVAWFVGFMDEASLWARMRPAVDDPTVNVPSPEDAILINLAHACYENKRLRLNDVLRVRFALHSGTLDWEYMERVAQSRGWLDGLCLMVLVFDAVERAMFGTASVPAEQRARMEHLLNRWPYAVRQRRQLTHDRVLRQPLDLGYWACKRLYYAKIVRDPAQPVGARWRDVGVTLLWGIKLKSRIRPQPGLVIALSGVDGSGKTAHARALVDALRLCELRADYLWARGGSTGLPGLVSTIRRTLTRAGVTRQSQSDVFSGVREAGGDTLARRRARLARPVPRLAWSWLVAVDQVMTYWLRSHLPSRLGRIVVADRHVLDTAIEMDAVLPADATWSRRAIAAMVKLAPRPDLSFVLDVSPATARARKAGESWQPDLHDAGEGYRVAAEEQGFRLLSTDGPFAESNNIVIRQSAMLLMSRFETWANSLFMANPSQKNTPDPYWQQSFRRAMGAGGGFDGGRKARLDPVGLTLGLAATATAVAAFSHLHGRSSR